MIVTAMIVAELDCRKSGRSGKLAEGDIVNF